MQDLQGFQYYDPSPVPPHEPWWRRRSVLIKFGVSLGVGLVLIFFVIGTVNLFKNRNLSKGKELMEQVAAVEQQLNADCDPADQICQDRARADAARSLGASQACAELSGDILTNCVTLIAQDKKDPEACALLGGDDLTKCLDSAYLLQAKHNTDIQLCKKISDTATRGACQFTLTNILINQGQCQLVGVEQAVCDLRAELKTVMATGVISACYDFEDLSLQEECRDGMKSIDADDDGLVLADEVELGLSDDIPDGDSDGLSDGAEAHTHATDPTNSDTDGDGFSDGTEVISGYNPLK